jgi:hypothetical protein
MALILPNTIANETPADGAKLQQNFATIADWGNQDAISADGSTAMRAPLLLPGAPTQPNQAATKAYADLVGTNTLASANATSKAYSDQVTTNIAKSAAPSFIQSGALTVVTNGFGDVIINFPVAFKGGTVPVVVLTNGYHGATYVTLAIQTSIGISAQGFGMRAWDTISNDVAASANVAVQWIAVGVPA